MRRPTKFDWSRADAMSDEDIHAAALSDPDAQPYTEKQWAEICRQLDARKGAGVRSVSRKHIVASTVRKSRIAD
jgi:hypothetical protein